MNLEEEKSKLFFYTILTLIFVIAIILRVMTFVNHNYYITTDELHGICLGKETFKSIFTHNFSGANFLPLYGALLKILYDISNFNYAIIKLPSLIASIASIFVFYKLTSKVISNKVVILSALTVFALNYNLIYYSQMAKPYIFDVLFTLIILYSTLNIRDELNNNSFNFKKLMFTTICSMLIVYMSTPSIVVIQICFGLLFLENIYKKNFTALRKLIIFELFVGSTLCIEYFTYINQMQANSSVKEQWLEDRFFFSPTSLDAVNALFNFSFFNFFWWDDECPYRFSNNFLIVYLAIFVLGILTFLKKENFNKGIYIITPIFFFLAISYLKIYPFCNRLITFLIPIFILVTFKVLDYSTNRKVKIFNSLISILIIIAFITFIINGKYMNFLLQFDKERYENQQTYFESLRNLKEDEVIVYNGLPYFSCLKNVNTILLHRYFYITNKKINEEFYEALKYKRIYFSFGEFDEPKEMIDEAIKTIEDNNFKKVFTYYHKTDKESHYHVFEKI